MDIELLYDRATTITHADMSGLVPTAATVVLRAPNGSQLQAPAVTLSTINTHANASSTTLMLDLDSVAGVKVGQPLAVTSFGETYVCTPVRIDGLHVHLAAALPVAPANNDTVKGLTMSASLSALGLAALGAGYQVEWRYENATAKGFATAEAACVRWLWQPAITAPEIAELLATVYQTTRSEEFCRTIADRVNDKIRNAIEQTGRRPFLYVSPRAFAEVGQIGARWVLADMGIALVGDIATLVREYRYAFGDELEKVINGLKAYDANNTGDTTPTKRPLYSLRTSR